ncbi:MAG TPA: Gfo/Idh/MocA family oxidoreductase [bacterium]|nr:Gfo/Idh/MocA family oxidoreductase [bacterium]
MKAAIIGACGGNAGNHIRAYKKLGIKISAIVDVNKKGKKLARELGAEFYSDYKDINESITDIASVSMPPYLQPIVTSHLLKRGISVLCEKPISPTVKEGKKLRKIISSTGKILMVGFCFRFSQKFIKLKELIESNVIGETLYINARYSAASNFKDNWRTDIKKGGGILLVNSIHYADLAPWLIGQKIETVDAYGSSRFHLKEAEDNSILILKHKDVCVTTVSGHYWIFKKSVVDFEVIGTKARATFEKNCIILDKNNGREEKVEYKENDMYYAEVKHFIECVKNKTSPQCGLEESLQATNIIEKARLSMLKGKRIWIKS